MAWTAGWFIAPVLLFVTWALTRSRTVRPGCVDAAGDPCLPPREEALAALLDNAIGLAGAVAFALLVSLVLRRVTTTWRNGTVGLASAVVGAGAATLLVAALG